MNSTVLPESSLIEPSKAEGILERFFEKRNVDCLTSAANEELCGGEIVESISVGIPTSSKIGEVCGISAEIKRVVIKKGRVVVRRVVHWIQFVDGVKAVVSVTIATL